MLPIKTVVTESPDPKSYGHSELMWFTECYENRLLEPWRGSSQLSIGTPTMRTKAGYIRRCVPLQTLQTNRVSQALTDGLFWVIDAFKIITST